MSNKWGSLAKFLVPLGTGVLAAHGIPLPLDQLINRPKRRRRRPRGSINHADLAVGIRDVLKAKLNEDELEEFDWFVAEFFRLVVQDRVDEEEKEEEPAPPPRRKRRKRATSKKAKRN